MDSTTLAYIAGFLDGDGSIFFQIVRRKDYVRGFQVRGSIAFYQRTDQHRILSFMKRQFGCGYIRHRKTGISDYTVVESKEVRRILLLLRPHVRLKKRQLELGLRILQRLESRKDADFLAACRLTDRFRRLNYSKRRTVTCASIAGSCPRRD